jgi:hypothetical protein
MAGTAGDLMFYLYSKIYSKCGIFNLGASVPSGPTGLSACIFFACGKKGYRFYPLRGSNGCRQRVLGVLNPPANKVTGGKRTKSVDCFPGQDWPTGSIADLYFYWFSGEYFYSFIF